MPSTFVVELGVEMLLHLLAVVHVGWCSLFLVDRTQSSAFGANGNGNGLLGPFLVFSQTTTFPTHTCQQLLSHL